MLDWGLTGDPDLVLKQALFWERSRYTTWKSREEVAAIDDDEWKDVNMMLRLLDYYRWLNRPASE